MTQRNYIEYCVHRGKEFGEDLDFIEGKFWRKARKLVEECKQGKQPDINYIEKVTHYLEPVYQCGTGEIVEWEPDGFRDEESLYDREEEQ